MRVADLIVLLRAIDPECRVFEERAGEHREVAPRDVYQATALFDADSGTMLHANDRRPSDPGDHGLASCPGFLVIGAWR